MELASLLTDCDAIVDTWFPGAQGGNGFADVLFGVVSPAGRTPQTFYQSNNDLPGMDNMDVYNPGITYRYWKKNVSLPFGFGLSYTTFSYSDISVSNDSPAACDTIYVSVLVKNTGTRDSDEVVQLYVKQLIPSAPVPIVRLGDFSRIHIPAGHTVLVTLVLTPEFHTTILDSDNFWEPNIVVEQGPLFLFVGGGQPAFFDGGVNTTVIVSNTVAWKNCTI